MSWALFLWGGCGGDDDSSLVSEGEPPDVAGHYNVILKGLTGCGGDATIVQDWAEGPLLISGEPDALTFDFGDGMAFSGVVHATRGYSFFDVVPWKEGTLSVSNSGTFTQSDGTWKMAGDFDVEVDEDPKYQQDNCSITGPMVATQLD